MLNYETVYDKCSECSVDDPRQYEGIKEYANHLLQEHQYDYREALAWATEWADEIMDEEMQMYMPTKRLEP
jgi:hypothetical protein